MFCVKSSLSVIAVIRLLNRDLSIKAAVELHDSKVESIVESDGSIELELKAYLHQSDGRPGIDPGTVWTQPVRLTFLNAKMQSTLVTYPDTIMNGLLTLSAERFENCFEIPLTHYGPTELHLEFANDIDLTIRGGGLHLEFLGIPTFVEKFTP